MDNAPYVTTISRQLGSGGSYIGRQVAYRLGISYMDREIISEAAERFQTSEHELAKFEEKPASLWESIFVGNLIDDMSYYPPRLLAPSPSNVFHTQSEIIKKVADERSAVIIGRGGHYVLKDRPRHLSVFIHAGIPFRIKRVVKLYQVTERQAVKMIEKYDNERARFIRQIANQDWMDACNYQLCIDTGVIGLDNAVNLIVYYLRDKFRQ